METKNPGISESKARIEGGSAAATRPSTPLSLSARLYGPEPGDSLFMRERRELQRGGDLPPDAVVQTSGFATIPRSTSLQGFGRCETVLQYRFDWR